MRTLLSSLFSQFAAHYALPAICTFCLLACSPQPQPVVPVPPPVGTPLYTAGMGNVRTWEGRFERRYSSTSPTWDTVSIHPDSTFALTILGPDSVSAFNTSYGHDTTDTILGIHYFGKAYNFYTAHSGDGVAYFYRRDSIAIIRSGIFYRYFVEQDVWTTKH